MLLDPRVLSERISVETGLEFVGTRGTDREGQQWLELCPAGHPASQTFTLRTLIGWRRIEVRFQPGRFAGELVAAMGQANENSRQIFRSIIGVCRDAGAAVGMTINGAFSEPVDNGIWSFEWRSLELTVKRGMLAINGGDDESDRHLVELWTLRAAATILALLPVEVDGEGAEAATPDVVGFPEGAKIKIETNRYERDRRNRAAALAIHGYRCKVCEVDMGLRYGPVASGMIEVHHTTPASEIGPGYLIDPRQDLLPLCPNCHSVAHRRTPPFSVDELRMMLRGN